MVGGEAHQEVKGRESAWRLEKEERKIGPEETNEEGQKEKSNKKQIRTADIDNVNNWDKETESGVRAQAGGRTRCVCVCVYELQEGKRVERKQGREPGRFYRFRVSAGSILHGVCGLLGSAFPLPCERSCKRSVGSP